MTFVGWPLDKRVWRFEKPLGQRRCATLHLGTTGQHCNARCLGDDPLTQYGRQRFGLQAPPQSGAVVEGASGQQSILI